MRIGLWTILGLAILLSAPLAHADGNAAADEVQAGAWRIRLAWRTETESGAFGFYVYRSDSPNGKMVCVNKENPLLAAGTTTTPQEYVFFDLDVEDGKTFYYKLEQMDLDGTRNWIVGDPEPVSGVPKELTEDEADEIAEHGALYRREGE